MSFDQNAVILYINDSNIFASYSLKDFAVVNGFYKINYTSRDQFLNKTGTMPQIIDATASSEFNIALFYVNSTFYYLGGKTSTFLESSVSFGSLSTLVDSNTGIPTAGATNDVNNIVYVSSNTTNRIRTYDVLTTVSSTSSILDHVALTAVIWISEWSLYIVMGPDPGTGLGCATSPDGVNWTQRSTPTAVTGSVTKLVYNPDSDLVYFYAHSNTNQVYSSVSSDGITWTLIENEDPYQGEFMYDPVSKFLVSNRGFATKDFITIIETQSKLNIETLTSNMIKLFGEFVLLSLSDTVGGGQMNLLSFKNKPLLDTNLQSHVFSDYRGNYYSGDFTKVSIQTLDYDPEFVPGSLTQIEDISMYPSCTNSIIKIGENLESPGLLQLSSVSSSVLVKGPLTAETGLTINSTLIDVSGSINGDLLVYDTGSTSYKTSDTINVSATRVSANRILLTDELHLGSINTYDQDDGSVNILGDIVLNSAVQNTIFFPATGQAIPSISSRSVGSKIVLTPSISGTTGDISIGVKDADTLWFQVPNSSANSGWDFYGAATKVAYITGEGDLRGQGKITLGPGSGVDLVLDGSPNLGDKLVYNSGPGQFESQSPKSIMKYTNTTQVIGTGSSLAIQFASVEYDNTNESYNFSGTEFKNTTSSTKYWIVGYTLETTTVSSGTLKCVLLHVSGERYAACDFIYNNKAYSSSSLVKMAPNDTILLNVKNSGIASATVNHVNAAFKSRFWMYEL